MPRSTRSLCITAAGLLASASCHAGQPGSVERTTPFEGGGTLRMSVASDGTALRITETYPAELAPHLDPKTCRGLLILDIDADNNASTGGSTRPGHGGYEYEETLWGCGPEYRESESPAPAGFYTTFRTKRFTSKDDSTERVHDLFWHSPALPIQGGTATISVPYAEMALKAGQVVRISTTEFEDVVLTLK